jgi:hypothetical protein
MKTQRSFYLTEEQATWLKMRAVERRMSASALVAEWIDSQMAPTFADLPPDMRIKEAPRTLAEFVIPIQPTGADAAKQRAAQRTKTHDILAKIAKTK